MKQHLNLSIFKVIVLSILFSSCQSQDNYGGLALYTLREEMKTNPKEVLKQVADIGYTYMKLLDTIIEHFTAWHLKHLNRI